MRMVWSVLLMLLGCDSSSSERDLCDFPSDVEVGTGVAELNGDEWNATGVAWNEAGTGLQVTTGIQDGWRMTLVIQADGLDDDGLGRIDLDGNDGWALVYPADGSSYSSQDGGGTLDLVLREDTVQICFDIEASGDDGTVVVDEAYFHAAALELGR